MNAYGEIRAIAIMLIDVADELDKLHGRVLDIAERILQLSQTMTPSTPVEDWHGKTNTWKGEQR